MIPTYAPMGSASFNRHLHEALRAIGADVRLALGDNLVALLLGGGYGRAEGAVLREDGEERPYNDLDLFVVVKRGWSRGADPLLQISEDHGHRLGIDVDFSRPVTAEDFRRLPMLLRWQDLLNGHVVVEGPADILTARAPAQLRQPLPTVEAARLLLNRGAGLLWTLRVAREEDPSPDPHFIRRNFNKCRLAMGDAVLIAHQRFQSSCRERDAALTRLATEAPSVGDLNLIPEYRDAVAFRLQPVSQADDALASDPGAALVQLAQRWTRSFLYVEQKRTGRSWRDVDSYSRWDGLREPEMNLPRRWGRNLLLNGRLSRVGVRYPRELIYRELPRLLSQAAHPPAEWNARTAELLKVWRWVN